MRHWPPLNRFEASIGSSPYSKSWLGICILLVWLLWDSMVNLTKFYLELCHHQTKIEGFQGFGFLEKQKLRMSLKPLHGIQQADSWTKEWQVFIPNNLGIATYGSLVNFTKHIPIIIRNSFFSFNLIESQSINKEKSWTTYLEEWGGSLKDVPWKAFFRSQAVWAMIYTHFCGSWGHYTCLSWLPTYFSEELNLNLTEAAWVSILPPLASVFVTSIAAQLADNLIANGVETTTVRKICQTIAFLSPAVCMTLSSLDLGLPPWEIVGILTAGLALSSFALSGLYCTHQDISPEYASILLGITNTVGAVPGIVGVALTGYLLDSTHSWSLSLFAPSIFFYLTGSIVWLAFASSKPQNFSTKDH
ncbi:hypothetical protein Patl1_13932 [Pistacia atlantica]|uniref:Uncharacterized protein n=1 Tax=Pistacia atlantica TaxID=434234 RepID=A0ACC1AVQ1_9ROSI|nr:hypothetical protein Patl1_13932 [Pistacia atlantica]